MSALRSPLQVPGFRRLLAAWAATHLADSLLLLILAVWVKDLTGSNTAAALVLAVFGLPALGAPFAGHLADRGSRRRLVVTTDLAAALGVLTLLAVRSADDVWLVYLVTFGYGWVGYLTSAAQSGLLRDLLPDTALAPANGLLSTVDQALRLVGPLVGAGLYVLAGPHPLVVAAAACFVLSAAILTRLSLAESLPAPREQRAPYLTELTAGFRHLRRTPLVSRLTIVLAVAFGATGLTNATSFAVIDEGLGLGPEVLPVLASIQGVGAVLGGLTAAAVLARLGEARTVAAGLGLLAAGLATTVTRSLPLVVVGVALLGLGVVWALVACVTLRQRTTPPELQGRAAAATTMVVNVPQTVLTLLAASLLVVLDYRVLVVGAALVVLAGAGSAVLPSVGRRGPTAAPAHTPAPSRRILAGDEPSQRRPAASPAP